MADADGGRAARFPARQRARQRARQACPPAQQLGRLVRHPSRRPGAPAAGHPAPVGRAAPPGAGVAGRCRLAPAGAVPVAAPARPGRHPLAAGAVAQRGRAWRTGVAAAAIAGRRCRGRSGTRRRAGRPCNLVVHRRATRCATAGGAAGLVVGGAGGGASPARFAPGRPGPAVAHRARCRHSGGPAPRCGQRAAAAPPAAAEH